MMTVTRKCRKSATILRVSARLGPSRSSETYSKYCSISKSEVEMLIDAGFLSLAKKLYIDNEDAVTYILSMFYKNDF